MTDRMQQVRLAQARAAVDEQRVVGLGRSLRDGRGRRLGEAVGGADHEGVEGVLAVEARVLAEPGLGGTRRAPRSRSRGGGGESGAGRERADRKSTRLNSSHVASAY